MAFNPLWPKTGQIQEVYSYEPQYGERLLLAVIGPFTQLKVLPFARQETTRQGEYRHR